MARKIRFPRKFFSSAVAFALGLPFLSQDSPTASKDEGTTKDRPNFVIVLTDDQRYDTLGCTGNEAVPTPHLDRLAREGTLFTRSYVMLALCSPSRASILTGMAAHRTKIGKNGPIRGFPSRGKIFPQLLQDAGYETAFVGKWHLSDGTEKTPPEGFDHWVSFYRQGAYYRQTLDVNGKEVPTTGFLTDELATRAAQWITEERTAPFFLMLSVKNCHKPWDPPERHRGQLDDKISEIPGRPDATPDEVAEYRRYLELVLSVDDGVGVLLEALEQAEQLDRTCFLFTSDNGHMLGQHGALDKSATFETSIQVPTLLRYPGKVSAGKKDSRLVLNLDYPVTFLDLAGVEAPADMQGRSLRPLWEEEQPTWRSATMHHSPVNNWERGPRQFALRTDRWKYIAYRADIERPDLLFDLNEDPGETRNLVEDPEHLELRGQLRSHLHTAMREFELPEGWVTAMGVAEK